MTAITLGLDIGTTGVKGIALDLEGGLLAQVSRSNELRSPHAGWAEADPAQWIENSHAVLAALAAHPAVNVARVVGIATTGMVPAVVALEASGVPLRRAILQNDARATAEVSEVAARLAEHDVIALTVAASRAWEQAGLPAADAQRALAPLIRASADGISERPLAQALTGHEIYTHRRRRRKTQTKRNTCPAR